MVFLESNVKIDQTYDNIYEQSVQVYHKPVK